MPAYFFIQYPPVVEQMVNDIATDIERRAHYIPNIRRGDGLLNVSAVIHIAIDRLLQDCPTITARQWADYREFYLQVRPQQGRTRQTGMKSISLTPPVEAQIAGVIAYLKAHGIEMPYIERRHGDRAYPNKPLVVALAVKHAHSRLEGAS